MLLLSTRNPSLVVLGVIGRADGRLTIVGFVLARTVGLFGFHLTFSSALAN